MAKQQLPTIPYQFDESLVDSARELHPQSKMPKALVLTYGCQMNFRDSEILEGQLQKLGYTITDNEEHADLILLNTCTVRETASQRIFGKIGELKRLKYVNPDLIIGVCGCIAQEERTTREIKQKIQHVDLVFGTHNIHRLPELIRRLRQEEGQVIDVWRSRSEVVEFLPSRRTDGIKAYVNIIYGCDKFCTFCIVPFVRGRERSREPEHVIDEVKALIASGHRDITLLGQNVSSYGQDLELDYDFADLLFELDQLPGDYRLRYTTSHPRDFSSRMVDVIANSEHIVEHYHLPVQAGSNDVLRRMNRRYTREHYLDLVRYIRQQDPAASITTDIIVGFPGETEKQFEETLSLVEEVQYDNAYTFIYSPRKGTVAAHWDDRVPEEAKKERLQRLMDLQYAVSLRKNRALEGTQDEVLVEGPSKKDPGVLSARTRTNRLVLIPEADAQRREALTGQFAHVEVVRGNTWTLEGRLISGEPTRALA